MPYKIPQLPLGFDLETKAVLKKTASARSALAELKGAATGIPNESILINTLSLQEAKDSSAIENIITTDDELYQADWNSKQYKNLATKEVVNYARALLVCFDKVRMMGVFTNNYIIDMQAAVVGNNAGYRKQPGTQLKNDKTGEVVYSVTKTTLQNLTLKIPNSLKEQTAIALVLQTADKEIQLLKAKTEKLKEQKKGLMQVLLTGKKRLKIDKD
jgi:restriction endonuclease S subunit